MSNLTDAERLEVERIKGYNDGYRDGKLDGGFEEREKIAKTPNPFEGYVDVTENIRMAKSQGFERFRQILKREK